MAAKPYTWEPWSKARSRMPEIWDGWSWNRDHAKKAMVDSLRRLDARYYRGEAKDLVAPWREISLGDVVSTLIDLSLGPSGSTAEYESPHGIPNYTGRRTKTAVLVGVELAWEEFNDDLIRFGLPRGATPNPEPAEASGGDRHDGRQERPRLRYKGPLAGWMARQSITLLRRMASSAIAADFKTYCETQRPDLLPLLPKTRPLRAMEGEVKRIMKKREAAATAADGETTASKGQ